MSNFEVMKESVFIIIWDSFKKFWGIPITIIGFILGFVLWKYSAGQTISLVIFIPLVVIFVIIIFTLFDSTIQLYKKYKENHIPPLLTCRINSGSLILFLGASERFAQDSIVAVYIVEEEEYEQLVALGVVINIQENKKIQVQIAQVFPGQEDIMTKLEQNNTSTIKQIIVKPNVPKALITFNSN